MLESLRPSVAGGVESSDNNTSTDGKNHGSGSSLQVLELKVTSGPKPVTKQPSSSRYNFFDSHQSPPRKCSVRGLDNSAGGALQTQRDVFDTLQQELAGVLGAFQTTLENE